MKLDTNIKNKIKYQIFFLFSSRAYNNAYQNLHCFQWNGKRQSDPIRSELDPRGGGSDEKLQPTQLIIYTQTREKKIWNISPYRFNIWKSLTRCGSRNCWKMETGNWGSRLCLGGRLLFYAQRVLLMTRNDSEPKFGFHWAAKPSPHREDGRTTAGKRCLGGGELCNGW